MAETFGRDYVLSLDAFDVSGLACVFKVTKDLKPHPNKCELEVRNMSESTRRLLEQKKIVAVRLRAGYKDRLFQLYLGTLRAGPSSIEGPDIVTRISSADSEKGIREGRVKVSVPAIPSGGSILTAIAKGLGVDAGNLPQQIGGELDAKIAAMYAGGRPLHGSAARVLSDVCRSTGHEWSVQDGRLLLLQRGKALAGRAILMRADAGMIGSPTVDAKGIVKCRALLVPEIVPGRLVRFDAASLKGFYRIAHVEYTGQTHGNDWFADFHARRVAS